MSDDKVINLQEIFSEKRFRIVYEEGHIANEADSVYYQRILCKYGFIYPWEGNLLAGCSENKRISDRWAREIKAGEWPECKINVHGDFEIVVIFPMGLVDRVAELLKARRKIRRSPEQRKKLLEMSKRYSPFRKRE